MGLGPSLALSPNQKSSWKGKGFGWIQRLSRKGEGIVNRRKVRRRAGHMGQQ